MALRSTAYLRIEDRVKPIHVYFFTNKLWMKKYTCQSQIICREIFFVCMKIIILFYLGHLNHVGELSKAGNGNHIMISFLFCAERQKIWKVKTSSVLFLIQRNPAGFLVSFYDALPPSNWAVNSKRTFPIDVVWSREHNGLYTWCFRAKIAWKRVEWGVCVCVSSGGGEYKEYNKQY